MSKTVEWWKRATQEIINWILMELIPIYLYFKYWSAKIYLAQIFEIFRFKILGSSMKKCETCAREKKTNFETPLCHLIYSLLSACSVSGTMLDTGNTKTNKIVCFKGTYSIMRRQISTQLITQQWDDISKRAQRATQPWLAIVKAPNHRRWRVLKDKYK